MSNSANAVSLEKIIALCKRRGFVYQAAEIYGGLNGVYDFGPLGAAMKANIRAAWTKALKHSGKDVVFFEGAILGPEAEWEASGHLEGFHDPMVDCTNCKHRFRADHIDLNKSCPDCGLKAWTQVRNFNLMFKTAVGATAESTSHAYLRPETAQAIFVNFKNVMTSSRSKIPFGIAQIGKAFRNEITPRQFLFRTREFEQMELEYFCQGAQALSDLEFWLDQRKQFYNNLQIDMTKIRFREHAADELAHYSSRCLDVEYEFPFGWKELEGIAYRGDYDLSRHTKFSGKDLAVFDDVTKQSFMPHVVECSVGVDRLFFTLLFDAYHEDLLDGETRVVLKLAPEIAPVKAAILPLQKQLNSQAELLYKQLSLSTDYNLDLDSSGSIGKRYRRQDEIGTPLCITYDFESETDQAVTVRDRDTMVQTRVKITDLKNHLDQILRKN